MRGADFVDMPFSQMISFPCELTLHTTPDGPRICRKPIKEIATLHNGQDTWKNRSLGKDETLPLEPSGQLFHIEAEVSIPDGAKLVFNLRGIKVVMTAKTIESGHNPATVREQVKKVEILVDRPSVEIRPAEGKRPLGESRGRPRHHPLARRVSPQLGMGGRN